MQTEKLFYEYTAGKPVTADIIDIRTLPDSNNDKTVLVLDKTIFYPGEGGQPGDRGTINGFALADIHEKEGEILHVICGVGQFKKGPAVLVLDSLRRRDFTVQHSAQHLLSGTLFRMTGCNTVSMHLGDEINTIDFNSPEITPEILLNAEETVAAVIEKNIPIITHLCPPEEITSFPLRKIPPRGEEVIRIVEIQDNDFTPCCGTHCKSTGQIGMMRILDAEKYKGMIRISFIAGRRVLLHHRMLYENAALISRSLSVPVNGTGSGVLDLAEKTNALERKVKELEDATAGMKARALLEKGKERSVIAETYPDTSAEEIIRIGKAAQKLSESVLILGSGKDLKIIALCSAAGRDIRPLLAGAFEKNKGKGGGNKSFFQGQFPAKENFDAFFDELKNVPGEGA
ncbi:MAG: alanyl-tRNA editing protein [Treponema sp.]|nr:alanyl-tRNA editing protein [Treponema sp.]